MVQQLVVNVDENEFGADVVERSKEVPVVVDFWASWCGPCRVLGPTLERLNAEDAGAWVLAKVDVDRNPGLAQRYRVQGIPAVKAFVDGQMVDEFVGALPQPQVRTWLKRFLHDPTDAVLKDARAQAEAGDLPGAEAALRAVLDERPTHAKARLALGEVLAAAGKADAAREVLKGIDDDVDFEVRRQRDAALMRLAGADLDVEALRTRIETDRADLDARWDLAHALAGAGEWEPALEQLLEIVRRDRTYRKDGGRKEMIRIFDVVGLRDPITERWRDKLARVLY